MLRVFLSMALENADTSLLQLLTLALGKDGFHFLSCSWLMFIYQMVSSFLLNCILPGP